MFNEINSNLYYQLWGHCHLIVIQAYLDNQIINRFTLIRIDSVVA